MRTDLFDYHLPQELIAARPPEKRDGGRLCIVEEERVSHDWVARLPDWIEAGDLIVLNDTRVRQARLFCARPSQGEFGGGKVELLFLHPGADGRWAALGRANRPLRVGDELRSEGLVLFVDERQADGTLWIRVQGDVERALEVEGTMPIPPYMLRPGDADDVERYQTVFARRLGSSAAPTAGLHLTQAMMATMVERGAEFASVTLHVGVGTFRPVTADDLDDHPMHHEEIEVSQEVCDAVARTRERNGRVIAIGTTAVRALESARDKDRRGWVQPTFESTDLLIQPGYRFSVVDGLLTNFHQPKSTLLALVSAFVGRQRVMNAYREAVEMRYRFLSYGDAMWLPRRIEETA